MTVAEESAKQDTDETPRGCVRAAAPDGATPIWVKPPRGPGPWWRVKHPAYGHRLVQAESQDDALRKFFAEFAPGFADDLAWCRESMKLNGGRVGKIPGSDPAPEARTEKPERAKK